jgi:hypothetical protein
VNTTSHTTADPRASVSLGIQWVCEVCGDPIANGEGYLSIDYADIERVEEFERRRRPREPRVVTLGEFVEGFPGLAHWRVVHEACDARPDWNLDYCIYVERMRTQGGALSWAAHLLGKNWIQSTDWDDVLRHASRLTPVGDA